MLKRLRVLLDTDPGKPPGEALTLELASAALLAEVARADDTLEPVEMAGILDALELFSEKRGQDLAALAERASTEAESSSLYPYTQFINDTLEPAEKSLLLQALWRVALADNRLDKHEEHLIRRIAGLLHLPPSEFIKAKLKAGG